jgi:hypothetical protein
MSSTKSSEKEQGFKSRVDWEALKRASIGIGVQVAAVAIGNLAGSVIQSLVQNRSGQISKAIVDAKVIPLNKLG